MARRRHPGPNATSPWPFVGMAGLACAFFLYAASGLLAPWWVVVVLLVLWVLMLILGLAWFTSHPRRVMGVAVFSIVLWFVVMMSGGIFLDWTA